MTDEVPTGPTTREEDAIELATLGHVTSAVERCKNCGEVERCHELFSDGLLCRDGELYEAGPVPTGPTIDHASYLGASDIGCVVDENHMARDASDVWGEKKGHLHFEGTVETELGNVFERPMLKVWADEMDLDVTFPGSMLHPVEQWAGATPDGVVVLHEAAVEAKIVGFQMRVHWGPEALGAEGVPAAVVIQVHWQAWVLRANGIAITTGLVVACFGTELRTYQFPIDDDLIDYLVDEGRAWWRHFVEGNVQPEGRAGKVLVAAIHPANVRPELDAPTEEVVELAMAYDTARAEEKAAKLFKDAAGVKLCSIIGDGSGFYGEGIKATWKANRGGKRSISVTVKKGR